MKKILLVLFSFCISICLFAQDTASAEPAATGLRANNKIYVVVAVLVTILAGLFIYLIRLDKKISGLEKSS
ncbi:MAG: CcmD family protein [Chitinophagaceae bacterium]|nr:CcmD family protein [Chitinophagaceae bacterium]